MGNVGYEFGVRIAVGTPNGYTMARTGIQLGMLDKGEIKMPLFITYASYSQSGVEGLLKNPSDRAEVIQGLLAKAGAKLVALYMTTGSNDIVLVSEAPDGSDAVAAGMAVAATGSISKVETVRAWTSAEFKSIAEKAAGLTGNYAPPGS
jgi:uncharacterized protein with GYD domain